MLHIMKMVGEGCLLALGVFIFVGLIGLGISFCQKYDLDGFELAIPVMVFLFVVGVVFIVLVKCMTGA